MNNSNHSPILLVRVPELELLEAGADLRSASMAGLAVPLGVSYIAASIRVRTDRHVVIYDMFAEHYAELMQRIRGNVDELVSFISRSLEKRLESVHPALVGLSAPFNYQHRVAALCARVVKAFNPVIPVYVGGYVTLLAEYALRDVPEYDIAFIGESERTMVDTLMHGPKMPGGQPRKGLGFLAKGVAQINSTPDYEEDLDLLPFPAFDLLPMDHYRKLLGKMELPLMTSRGCPFDCAYCSSRLYSCRKLRRHSIDYLRKLLEYMRDEFSFDTLYIRDDNIGVNKDHAKSVLRALMQIQPDAKWLDSNGFHVDSLDEEFLDLCKASGCMAMILAIESASPRVLRDVMHKKVDLGHARKVAAYCQAIDLPLEAYFVVGNPTETVDEIKQTVDFALEIGVEHCAFSIATPFPGTDYFRWAIETGAISADPDTVLNMKYMNACMSTGTLSAEELKQLQYDANIRVNFLENRLLRGDSEQLKKAKLKYKHVAEQYPFHAIAVIVYGFVCGRLGDDHSRVAQYQKADEMLRDPQIQDAYARYVEWATEVTRDFASWRKERRGILNERG